MAEQPMTPEQKQAQAEINAKGQAVARLIDQALNGDGPRRIGFAVLLFEFGEPPQPATYLSNGTREDMIRAIEEWLERVNG